MVLAALFQSRGRDLLIGKSSVKLISASVGVSVPWSGFINRKVWGLLDRIGTGGFQSRGRDLLIGKPLPPPPQKLPACFSPVVGIY